MKFQFSVLVAIAMFSAKQAASSPVPQDDGGGSVLDPILSILGGLTGIIPPLTLPPVAVPTVLPGGGSD